LYFSDDSFNVMVAPLSIPRPSKTCGQSFEHPGYGELITARGVRFSTPLHAPDRSRAGELAVRLPQKAKFPKSPKRELCQFALGG